MAKFNESAMDFREVFAELPVPGSLEEDTVLIMPQHSGCARQEMVLIRSSQEIPQEKQCIVNPMGSSQIQEEFFFMGFITVTFVLSPGAKRDLVTL